MSKETIRKHFDEAAEVLKSFNNDENHTKIANAIILMSEALSNGNKIISCGNGG